MFKQYFFRKISENEYVPDQGLTNIVELTGFPDNGPKNFIVTSGVSMYKLNDLEYHKVYETRAKENFAYIEFSTNYVKWD